VSGIAVTHSISAVSFAMTIVRTIGTHLRVLAGREPVKDRGHGIMRRHEDESRTESFEAL